MNKTEAQTAIKKIQVESSALETSGLITLFELDISSALQNIGIFVNESEKYFYFHNNTKLIITDIKFQGKTYAICPIQATGFDITSQGTLPTPLLSMTVSDDGISSFNLLKQKLKYIGDLVGCKITRRRTFAKFLSLNNFNINNIPSSIDVNELAELPPDRWIINRKSNENKNILEYELTSVLDLENIKLPKRLMVKKCVATYRGEGCLYEYDSRRNDNVHGETSILPEQAPPVATEDDKLIKDIIGVSNINDLGPYQQGATYQLGQSVYLETEGIKYYFVAKRNNVNSMPPNTSDWIADKCSKCLRGCKLRYSASNPTGSVVVGNSGLIPGELPFVGFIGLDRNR